MAVAQAQAERGRVPTPRDAQRHLRRSRDRATAAAIEATARGSGSSCASHSERADQDGKMNVGRNWQKHAKALDMKLAGATFDEVGLELGVSRERARQIVRVAARRLAYRVFVGVERFDWEWDKHNGRWKRYG